MFENAMDFANLKKENCTPSKILQIFAKNEVIFSSNDWEATFDTNCVFDKYHIFLTEPSAKMREYREKLKNDKDNYKFPFIFPEDSNYKDILLTEVNSIRKEIKSWFNYIIENGNIDKEKLKNFLSDNNIKLNMFSELEDKFTPEFYISPCTDKLKNYIISHDFIIPLYEGYGKDFKRIKRCPECKKYFYAKDLRQIFCGTECKNANFYKNKKGTEN